MNIVDFYEIIFKEDIHSNINNKLKLKQINIDIIEKGITEMIKSKNKFIFSLDVLKLLEPYFTYDHIELFLNKYRFHVKVNWIKQKYNWIKVNDNSFEFMFELREKYDEKYKNVAAIELKKTNNDVLILNIINKYIG